VDAFSDKTTRTSYDSVLLPTSLQGDKTLLFSFGRFAHGRNFLIVKSEKNKTYYLLEHVLNKNIFLWQSNVQESVINEWFGPSFLRFFYKEFQYKGYWIQDSGNKRFFLNKLKFSPDAARPLRYESVWQYDFQNRKVKEALPYGMAGKNFILNVYVEDAPKRGWWALALNDDNGKVKHYRRLTRDNDSLTHRLEYFMYDTTYKQFLVITGKNYTLKDFGKNKKEIHFSILDTNLEVQRTWTFFVNTNTKVMKELKIDYVQPMHYAALALNETDFSVSAWGWGLKNAYYFPVAYYERTLLTEKPIFKTSINSSPTDLLMRNLSIEKKRMDTIPAITNINEFGIHYPTYMDTSVYINIITDKEYKYINILQPIPSSLIAVTTFIIRESIKMPKDEPLALFKSKYFVWIVNQKKGKVVIAHRRK
jgi:hypothetical protein